MLEHVVFEILKLLAPVLEDFPDNPRLGRKLLLGGSILICTIVTPTKSPEWGETIFILKALCVITGVICVLLGAFVFLRRWVWGRQERRAPVITSLRLK